MERLNRTIKTWMWQRFGLNGNKKWVKLLPELMKFYNARKHRTINMPPNKVNKANEKTLLHTVYNYQNVYKKPKFKVGDFVRISKIKGTFAKGFTASWSLEVFVVHKISLTSPITYHLKDLHGEEVSGGFYHNELLKTSRPNTRLVDKIVKKRKDGKVFVKFEGLENNNNAWVKKSDIYHKTVNFTK